MRLLSERSRRQHACVAWNLHVQLNRKIKRTGVQAHTGQNWTAMKKVGAKKQYRRATYSVCQVLIKIQITMLIMRPDWGQRFYPLRHQGQYRVKVNLIGFATGTDGCVVLVRYKVAPLHNIIDGIETSDCKILAHIMGRRISNCQNVRRQAHECRQRS